MKLLCRAEALTSAVFCESQKTKHTMRNILLPIVGAILLMSVFSSCTTTVKAPSGRTASVGVHTDR